MPIALSRDQVVAVLNGKVVESDAKLSFSGVEFNSGDVRGGELFIALKGAVRHGHEFLEQAFGRGASLALIEDEKLFSTHPNPERLVYVPDTLKAFQDLACWWRRELKLPVIAVTGSVGKTTTKELIGAILLQQSRGVYSLKSHNNHTGVPYTILRASKEHHWIVLEMGMNHPGELTVVSKVGEPNVAIITCIAPSHIGNFGGLEAICAAKLEVTAGLPTGGTLVINGADPVLAKGASALPASQKIVVFGDTPESLVKVESVQSHGLEGITVALSIAGAAGAKEQLAVRIDLIGRKNSQNVAAAVLGARTLFPELPLAAIEKGLQQFRAPLMRLNLKNLPDGRMILDDSYNAGPDSMHALLELGEDLQKEGKKVGCVLGDMRELGSFSEQYHKEVGEHLGRLRPAFVVGVGEFAKIYLEEAKKAGVPATHAENPEVAAHIARKLRFDILFVKGSRGIGLEKTVKTLEMH